MKAIKFLGFFTALMVSFSTFANSAKCPCSKIYQEAINDFNLLGANFKRDCYHVRGYKFNHELIEASWHPSYGEYKSLYTMLGVSSDHKSCAVMQAGENFEGQTKVWPQSGSTIRNISPGQVQACLKFIRSYCHR